MPTQDSHWILGYLGPPGSHSHHAGRQLRRLLASQAVETEEPLVPFASFAALMRAATDNPRLWAILPVENLLTPDYLRRLMWAPPETREPVRRNVEPYWSPPGPYRIMMPFCSVLSTELSGSSAPCVSAR